jgi:hypothetical protein
MRRWRESMDMRRSLSNNTVSSSTRRPASGSSRPEMSEISVVLPHPDRPKTAVTPGVGA